MTTKTTEKKAAEMPKERRDELQAMADEHASYVAAGNLTSLMGMWKTQYKLRVTQKDGVTKVTCKGITGKATSNERTAFENWGNAARRALLKGGA